MTTTGVICKPRSRARSPSPSGGSSHRHELHRRTCLCERRCAITRPLVDRRAGLAAGRHQLRWRNQLCGMDIQCAGPTRRIGTATPPGDQVTLTNIDHLSVILAQPPGTLAVPDRYPINLSITVAAIGDMPMTYQWQHSETNLSDNGPFSGPRRPY